MSKRGKLMEQTFSFSNPTLFNEISGFSVFEMDESSLSTWNPYCHAGGWGWGNPCMTLMVQGFVLLDLCFLCGWREPICCRVGLICHC